jgi:hypothetical protein
MVDSKRLATQNGARASRAAPRNSTVGTDSTDSNRQHDRQSQLRPARPARSHVHSAGYVAGVNDIDPQFQNLVTERIAAGNPEREDSPNVPAQASETARAGERDSERRSAPEEAHPSRGRRRGTERAGHRAQAQVVRCRVPHPVCQGARAPEHAIDDASDRGSFGLAQSTAQGKALVRILVLAAVTNKHGPEALRPHGAPGRSWLAWVADAARDQHPLVAAVSTKSCPRTRPRS